MNPSKRQSLCVLTFFAITGCSYNVRPTVPATPQIVSSQSQIQCKVVLLMPEEFEKREYVSSFEGREVRVRIGEPASEAMEGLIRARYSVVTMKQAVGDGTLDFLQAATTSKQQGNLVMRPRFTRLDSSVRPFQYSLEFGIAVDVAGLSAPITPAGNGTGSAGFYSEAAIQKAVDNALSGAIAGLASTLSTTCK